MFKKNILASKGTKRIAHKGKGSQSAALPDRAQVAGLGRPGASSMNDYAKATPMAQGVPATPEGGPPGGPWLT